MRAACAVVAVALAAALPAHAGQVAWPDNFLARVEAQAIVQTLNADILSSRSATLTLEHWCAVHHLSGAADAKIVAKLIRGQDKPATAEQRERLAVGPDEPLNYRFVRLTCGERVLSIADNWYVPSRLTAEMNRSLETTETPFGKAVLDLHPYRQTFAVKVLWHPLPEDWEATSPPVDSGGTMQIPDELFEHQADLYTKDGKPFSEVDEHYQKALLDFPLPKP